MKDYRKQLREIRAELTNNIREVFNRNGKTETNSWCDVTCVTYVIEDGDVYGQYTLNRVCLDNNGNVVFEASNSYDCDEFTYIDLETMIDIYEDMLKYEADLFADDDESDESGKNGEYEVRFRLLPIESLGIGE